MGCVWDCDVRNGLVMSIISYGWVIVQNDGKNTGGDEPRTLQVIDVIRIYSG